MLLSKKLVVGEHISWQELFGTIYVFDEKKGIVYSFDNCAKELWLQLITLFERDLNEQALNLSNDEINTLKIFTKYLTHFGYTEIT